MKRRNEIGANKRKRIRWIRIREEEKARGREANKERKRKGKWIYIERDRYERNKKEIFSAFRQSELDSPRRKVDPRIATYAWVPKSGSFVKLQEGGNFPTWNIFNLKVM